MAELPDPHAIAARAAPQVGVSASLLEKELATELEHRPAAGVAFPACILIVLLVVRSVLDWRHRRQQMQQAAAVSRTRTLVWDAALLAVAVLLFPLSIGVGSASPQPPQDTERFGRVCLAPR